MLIWINGAFGAGKTHTAHEMHRRVPGSHVADPELIGFAMHKMLPASERQDFQDLPGWRAAVVTTLRTAERTAGGPVIVPMTVGRHEYFDEIVGSLRTDTDVRHYTLVASPATLRTRLGSRLEAVGSRVFGGDGTWAMQQIDRCVTALDDPRFATHIPTDGRSLDEVVETIAADAGLLLSRPRLSPLHFQLRRLSVAARHIRF